MAEFAKLTSPRYAFGDFVLEPSQQEVRRLDEQEQGVEEPRREIQRTAVATPHLLLRWLQQEVTEGIAGRRELGEFSHFSGTFQPAANDFRGRSAHCADVGPRAAPDPGG